MPQAGSFAHWNQLRDDLKRMIDELQWVDPTLGATLLFRLSEARAALDAGDGTAAKDALQTLLDTLAQAPVGQLRPEARTLIELNADALIANTPNGRISAASADGNLLAAVPHGAHFNSLIVKAIIMVPAGIPVVNMSPRITQPSSARAVRTPS